MNMTQRLVLIAIALGTLVMLLWPPFYTQYANGVVDNLGYHYLFSPPQQGRAMGIVHAPTLFVQFLGLLIIGGTAWFLSGSFGQKKGNSAEFPSEAGGATLGGREVKFDPAAAALISSSATMTRHRKAFRLAKRVGLTFLAFLASGVLVALWTEHLPPTSLSGALMAATAFGVVWGAWRLSGKLR